MSQADCLKKQSSGERTSTREGGRRAEGRGGEGRLSVAPRPRYRGIFLCPPPTGRDGRASQSAQVASGPCSRAQELLFPVSRVVGKGAVCQQDPLSRRQGSIPGPGLDLPRPSTGVPGAPLEEEDAGGSALPMCPPALSWAQLLTRGRVWTSLVASG